MLPHSVLFAVWRTNGPVGADQCRGRLCPLRPDVQAVPHLLQGAVPATSPAAAGDDDYEDHRGDDHVCLTTALPRLELFPSVAAELVHCAPFGGGSGRGGTGRGRPSGYC